MNNSRIKYGSTDYLDFNDYYENGKILWEEMINSEKEMLSLQAGAWERTHKNNQALWKIFKNKKTKDFEPVWVKEYLGRQQFYRQNNLPVELNMLIEEWATNYTGSFQQKNHQRLIEQEKERYYYLNNIARYQESIKEYEQEKKEYLANIQEALNTEIPSIQELREKDRKEKEIKYLLAKEIKEQKEKWENYLNTKPLPELPKSKFKVLGNKLGNKIKTELKQIIKPTTVAQIQINCYPRLWMMMK